MVKIKLLTEDFVQDKIIDFLSKQGWSKNLSSKGLKEHGIVLRRLPYDVCDKLNLYVFFVDEKGEVEVYDWKAIRNQK